MIKIDYGMRYNYWLGEWWRQIHQNHQTQSHLNDWPKKKKIHLNETQIKSGPKN